MSLKDGKIHAVNEKERSNTNIKLVYELVLIISGVFVFRSLWTILDSIDLFNRISVHIILLFVGIILSLYALHKIVD